MIRAIYLACLAFAAFALFGQTAEACVVITGDQITGRDLANALPQLASVPADATFGYAPAPGVERSFSAGELQRLANRYGVNAKITTSVCFGWQVNKLSREQISAAIRKSLAGHEVELEIVDQSHSSTPQGELVFPLQGLSQGAAKAAVWTGYVLYGGGKKFNTWVQVRITVHEEQVVAARAIRTGESIDAAALKKVDYRGPLLRTLALRKEEEVTGKCARRPIAEGTVLSEAMLALPQDVDKEQLVIVHSDCGAAHIETQGIASEAGYRGDVIRVRNPKTGRVFRAKIDDRGIVTVIDGGNAGLVVEGKKS